MYDLTVAVPSVSPELGIRKEGQSVIIFWRSSVIGTC
jgi:hypothetical protein